MLSEEQEINQVISTFLRKELIYKKTIITLLKQKILRITNSDNQRRAQTQGALRVKIT